LSQRPKDRVKFTPRLHPTRPLFVLLILTAAATAAFPHLSEKRPEQKIGVFSFPTALLGDDTQSAADTLKSLPRIPNHFGDYLPGKLYDMRRRLEPCGASFGGHDFAWFNPHLQVLVVGVAPNDMAIVQRFVEGLVISSDALANLVLKGEVTIGEGPSRKGQPARQATCEVYGSSGMRTSRSAKASHGISYDLQIEPVTTADGTAVDCRLILKVEYEGNDYKLATESVVPFSKVQTQLVGTTPRGERVEFHLSTTAIFAGPESPLMDGKWKEGLLKRLKSTPQSARH
jgi:hypothetical protein